MNQITLLYDKLCQIITYFLLFLPGNNDCYQNAKNVWHPITWKPIYKNSPLTILL